MRLLLLKQELYEGVIFLARELKPCGTSAAARRHRRNGEELCDECRVAVRDEKNARKREDRQEDAVAFHESMSNELPESSDFDDPIDALDEARDSLMIVRKALHSEMTMPHVIGPLTKRRDELVDRIQGLEKAAAPEEVSVFDELEQKRESSRKRNTG